MKIWNFSISLAFVALGLMAWRHGDWAGSEENFRGDSACQGLEQLFYYGISLVLFGHAVGALFMRGKHLLAMLDESNPPVADGREVTRPGREYNELFR